MLPGRLVISSPAVARMQRGSPYAGRLCAISNDGDIMPDQSRGLIDALQSMLGDGPTAAAYVLVALVICGAGVWRHDST